MNDLSNNSPSDPELDGLFRNLAQYYEPPYDPSAWAQMQRRLDQYQSHAAPARLTMLAVALLFVAGGQWQSSRPVAVQAAPSVAVVSALAPSKIGTINLPTAQQNVKTRSIVDAPVRSWPSAKPTQEQMVVQSATTPRLTVISATEKQPAETSNAVANRVASTPKHQSALASAMPDISANVVKTIIRLNRRNAANLLSISWLADKKSVQIKKPVQLLARSVIEQTAEPVAELVSEIPEKPTLPDVLTVQPRLMPIATLQLDSVVTTLPVSLADLPNETPITTLKTVCISKPTLTHRIALMLVASPDASATGQTNFVEPGVNFGALIEYKVANRWSVQIGAIRSTKQYFARTGPPETWRMTLGFNAVAAHTDLIDIPLNVRFDLLPGRSSASQQMRTNRLFVSAGLTTYIILRESYQYSYANPNDQRIQFRDWQNDDSRTRYTFSQANFSLGYERPLSNHISVQVEPFMKLPITSIGVLNIRLITTGVFFGLRYRF